MTVIYALVQRFCQENPLPKPRGRPTNTPKRSSSPSFLLGVREHAFYRRLLFALALEILTDHPLPALATLVYRFTLFSCCLLPTVVL